MIVRRRFTATYAGTIMCKRAREKTRKREKKKTVIRINTSWYIHTRSQLLNETPKTEYWCCCLIFSFQSFVTYQNNSFCLSISTQMNFFVDFNFFLFFFGLKSLFLDTIHSFFFVCVPSKKSTVCFRWTTMKQYAQHIFIHRHHLHAYTTDEEIILNNKKNFLIEHEAINEKFEFTIFFCYCFCCCCCCSSRLRVFWSINTNNFDKNRMKKKTQKYEWMEKDCCGLFSNFFTVFFFFFFSIAYVRIDICRRRGADKLFFW